MALEPIKYGSEIRFDHSTTVRERSSAMECRCGKPSCRKVVEDFDKLPPAKREYYIVRRVVMAFIAASPFWSGRTNDQH